MSKNFWNWLSALIASSGLLLIGYIVVQFVPADNPIEEIVEDALEQLIEDHTGIDVDIDFSKD